MGYKYGRVRKDFEPVGYTFNLELRRSGGQWRSGA
jgi:hypothetical protein